jgi:hypothetical protein
MSAPETPEMLRELLRGAQAIPIEETVADALGDALTARVDQDGVVHAAFGVANTHGAPTLRLADATSNPALAPLTGDAVRDALVRDDNFRRHLGLRLSNVDCGAVAEILRARLTKRRQQLDEQAAKARRAARETTAAEAERAQRRAALLAELAKVDGDEPDQAQVTQQGTQRGRRFR